MRHAYRSEDKLTYQGHLLRVVKARGKAMWRTLKAVCKPARTTTFATEHSGTYHTGEDLDTISDKPLEGVGED